MFKNLFYKITLICCLFFVPAHAYSWQVYFNQPPTLSVKNKLILLEPDNWQKQDISELKLKNNVPVAWLNIMQVEPERIIPEEFKAKDILIKRRYHPKGGELARFYSQSFKKLMKQRIREYIEKGFMGILLARPFLYSSISNNPINRIEMKKLLDELHSEIKSLDPKLLVLVHGSIELFPAIKKSSQIDGIVMEGMFNSQKGKHKHPWQRKEQFSKLANWVRAEKIVLCVDETNTKKRIEFIKKKCFSKGFEPAFHKLPLLPQRSINKWWIEKK